MMVSNERPALDLTDQRGLLLHFRPWLRRVAGGMMHSRPSLAEDLAQEGWIEIWRASRRYDPSKNSSAEAFLKHCATQRMLTVIRDWCAQQRDMRVTFATTPSDTIDLADLMALNAIIETDGLELDYHEGRIKQALEVLDERERWYVEQRFWHGLDHKAMEKTLGRYVPQTMWRWIRPKLEAELMK